ncbi:MAG: tRNA (adenosine(37)-N6)-dimethylallyltransferase MiaA [Bacteroidetes bacterium]|nr:tRNA (adenosine(37)-N6)-dimethylallyltransferase MiaA [Bacteroidota bacterium]
MNLKKTLVCVVGATASGKTTTAIELAQALNTEIVSADSRQFYKELSIGTAKPTIEELAAATHHFVSHKSILETYSAGDFEKDALQKIKELFQIHNHVIMVGGSGMYINAVCNGLDALPKATEATRSEIIERYQKEGLQFLQQEVHAKDPAYFKTVDIQNPQRLMRALEVIYTTGMPFSNFLKQQAMVRDFDILKIGMHWERAALYRRINTRVDEMIEQGLEKEASRFIEHKQNYALRTVGYTEFFDYFEGKQNLPQTIELIKQHTRNFAKRQLTWFKRDTTIKWVDFKNKNAIFAALNSTL